MSATGDAIWSELAETWRATTDLPAAAATLKRSADRQTRMMRLSLGAEILVTLVTLGLVWWVVTGERGPISLGWVVGAGVHAAIVWGFTLWNRAGIWAPLGRSTVDYLRLTRTRFERQRRAAAFTLWLVGIETAALAGWIAIRSGWTGSGWRLAWLPGLVVIGSAIGWAIWSGRRARTARARLATIESQLAGDGPGGSSPETVATPTGR